MSLNGNTAVSVNGATTLYLGLFFSHGIGPAYLFGFTKILFFCVMASVRRHMSVELWLRRQLSAAWGLQRNNYWRFLLQQKTAMRSIAIDILLLFPPAQWGLYPVSSHGHRRSIAN